MTRMVRSLVTAAACASLLSGCFFFMFPLPAFGPGMQERLDKFTDETAKKGGETAVAVAKDEKKWAWGGAWHHETSERAQNAALFQCGEVATKNEIKSPCQIYAVNGQIVK